MTIGGWIAFGFFASIIAIAGVFIGVGVVDSVAGKVLTAIISVVLIVGLLFGMRWYYANTASGQRAIVDQRSELNSGLERTVTVYTADGNVIASYSGKIDIESNDGGYIKFDFEGKRYIYYNCFVESIAEIG